MAYKNETPDCRYMTDSKGVPVPSDAHSLTVGNEGPGLMEDVLFHDKLGHFDRERIPERVVHAKGAGAFGYFESYYNMNKYTMAAFLQGQRLKTKVFVRFSTVIGGRGSADTVRDPRGFAVKFYTAQGNYDIVGNDLPVFFIRDAIRFPDVIHALKPAPDSNLRDPQRFWDFVSMMPEATHMLTWLYSDRGTIKDYRHVDGFGVNTYVWVNSAGQRIFIKYHWKTKQGLQTIDRFEAEKLAGEKPDIAVENLRKAIDCGECPQWELCVQMMSPSMAEKLCFDPLDDTKTWPEDKFPLMPVGIMTLNQNPENFFAQVEQAAFCPGNLIPGVELSADKMLQGRSFSYLDTQRYRLGVNFSQLPVNRPLVPVCNNERDGAATYTVNPEPVNYSPNSLNGNRPAPYPMPDYPGMCSSGYAVRASIDRTDDFTQAGERYRSLSDMEKLHLIDNIAVELWRCRSDIIKRVLEYLTAACEELGQKVHAAVCAYQKKGGRV